MADATDINVDELRRRARRRLIGAIVLALAAAVIVPMLLESDPKPLGEDVSVRIPPEDNAKFVNRLSDKAATTRALPSSPRTEPAKEPAKADSAAVPAPAPAMAPESTAAVTNVPAAKKSISQAEQKVLGAAVKAEATAAPAPAPATTPALSANAATPALVEANKDAPREGFSVQLAAFADDKGANSLANKLKRAAYPAYTEPLTTSKGTLWRVRVGPFASRDEAVVVRDKLKGEGYSGIVAVAK